MENQSQASLNDREREECEGASIEEQMGSIARSESSEEPTLPQFNGSDKILSNLDFYLYSDFVLARPEKVRPIYSKFRDQ